jgi:hypothetical protein
MEQTTHTEQFLRQRKMMLMLPLLVLPMLCLAFYGLGGGKGGNDSLSAGPQGKGLNMSLPLAHFDKKAGITDKLGSYAKAALDSVRRQESRKQDPYYSASSASAPPAADTGNRWKVSRDAWLNEQSRSGTGIPPAFGGNNTDRQADRVLERLEALKKVLNQPAVSGGGTAPGTDNHVPGLAPGYGNARGDTGRGASTDWQRVLQSLKQNSSAQDDPEMSRLNGMLDKIIRIQHPDEGHSGDTTPSSFFRSGVAVAPAREDQSVRIFQGEGTSTLPAGGAQIQDGGTEDVSVGFITIGSQGNDDTVAETGIRAEVAETQTLTSGATVAIRLTEAAVLAGARLPAGSMAWGKATLSGERLLISLSSIQNAGRYYPVTLEVFGLDGLPGIRVDGSLNRDVAKESANEAISGLGIASVDPSLGAQAASAGLEAAKSLISRKIRLVRVTLHSGYAVILKNSKH